MYTPLFSRPLGIFGALTSYHYHISVILAITNAISKNLPSNGTKWLPIMMYIHPPEHDEFYFM
jgi:hypothetical protein